ncbi:MAG: preprotein translocase subunit YajC [Leifsonia sp.]|nr:preprotein translocase subunit YajC [Leifsonia sp.]MAT18113.1 preprotein translocase subunit YajC [Leifsonia sp.]|tara:strand:- start:161032 stop:161442 length:411 start_codon:yes stop_codon:yes gene_type:complete
MDPLTIGLFALIAVMIFFMFRNSRKRRQEAEELALKMVPGAEIMTQHGIYGTLVSLDEEKNEAIIETTPGTQLRVHRQTLARVVEPEVAEEEDTEVESSEPTYSLNEDTAIPAEPEFGERSDEAKPKRAPRKKAAE